MTRDANGATYAALIDQLSAEHAELLPHTDKLLDLSVNDSAELSAAIESCAAKLEATLDAHIAQEDEILFPAYANASGGDGVVAQFRDEHRDIVALRNQLLAAWRGGDNQALSGITIRLAELLCSHMQREDMVLFPSARAALC